METRLQPPLLPLMAAAGGGRGVAKNNHSLHENICDVLPSRDAMVNIHGPTVGCRSRGGMRKRWVVDPDASLCLDDV